MSPKNYISVLEIFVSELPFYTVELVLRWDKKLKYFVNGKFKYTSKVKEHHSMVGLKTKLGEKWLRKVGGHLASPPDVVC